MIWRSHHRWVAVSMVLLVAGASAVAWFDGPWPRATHNAAQLPPAAEQPIDFQRDIWPILEESCVRCHGPQKQKGGLRLDHQEAALAGGESGKAIVLGNSAASPLIHRVASLDDTERMPQVGAPLTN